MIMKILTMVMMRINNIQANTTQVCLFQDCSCMAISKKIIVSFHTFYRLLNICT